MKYKVGDRVRIVTTWPKDDSAMQNPDGYMDKWLGKVMTIRAVDEGHYLMEEDSGDRKEWGDDAGWYWWPAAIAGRAHDTHKIVITTDGTTTLARRYNGKTFVKSAEAKCNPEDAFDFMTGAKLAMERLLGEEPEKAPAFTKADLKDGMFCRLGGASWFVVAGDLAVFEDGDYCFMSDLRGDLTWSVAGAIEVVLEGVHCFNFARLVRAGSPSVRYIRPGAKF